VIVRSASLEDVGSIADLDWRVLHDPFIEGPRRDERREALMAVWPALFESPEARLYVCEREQRFVGFAAVRIVVGEAELDAIAVEPSARGCGAGRSLLEFVIGDLAAAQVARIGLEVRASNGAARALYMSSGFQEDGVRRRYYENGEDALLLGLPLNGRTSTPGR
jgi:ribosomal-protein-alanine N-acetyltransferase